MAEDRPEDAAVSPDSGRVRRPPPTIDLEATEVSERPRDLAGEPAAAEADPPRSEERPEEPEPRAGSREPDSGESKPGNSGRGAAEAISPAPISPAPISPAPISPAPISPAPISPWVIAPVSGAVAAALVIGVGWVLGWPAVQPAHAPQAGAISGLASRLAGLEARLNQPAPPDPGAARLAALEKTVASLRDQFAGLQTQSDKLAGEIGSAGSATGDAAAAVDLSAINARLDQLDQAVRAASAAAQDRARAAADDTPLRRAVVASLLDLSVRQGEPFQVVLDAAKSLAPDAGLLTPLESFAAAGVPTSAALSRELLTLIPKLSQPAKAGEAAGPTLVDRLETGASRLVRIERTDGAGNDRGAIVARATAAALHNDSNQARRELDALSPSDRAPAQGWIDKADARDAALAASRQFAADALAALGRAAP